MCEYLDGVDVNRFLMANDGYTRSSDTMFYPYD